MTSRTCWSAARQSPPEATTCARKRRRRSDSGPRPSRAVASNFDAAPVRRVLVRQREQAVPRDRRHAHVGAALGDRERDVDHREPGADQQHARHVGRQALHPAQVPGVVHDVGGARERRRGRRVAEREQHAVGLDHRTVVERDACARAGDVDRRRAGARPLEGQPARAAALREPRAGRRDSRRTRTAAGNRRRTRAGCGRARTRENRPASRGTRTSSRRAR